MGKQTSNTTKRCLLCGTAGVEIKRGLCPAHHAQYLRARRTADDPEEFDRHLIEVGMLLPSQKGRRLAPGEDAFRAELAQLEGRPEEEITYEPKRSGRKPADEAAAEKLAEAEEEARNQEARPKTPKKQTTKKRRK